MNLLIKYLKYISINKILHKFNISNMKKVSTPCVRDNKISEKKKKKKQKKKTKKNKKKKRKKYLIKPLTKAQ